MRSIESTTADIRYAVRHFRRTPLSTITMVLVLSLGIGSNVVLFTLLNSLGYLVFRSGFLPRTIGALMGIAGVCYLVNSLSQFLAPAFGATLFPALFVPIFVAELSLALWLIVKGVDVAKWEERAQLTRVGAA